MKLYNFLHGLLGGILRFLFCVRVRDRDKEPREGNYLVCANHTGMADPIILMVGLRYLRVHFMAKKELFKIPLLSSFIRAFGAFPVDRKGSSVAAIKTAVTALKEGNSVSMFPQGTRCSYVDPRTTEVKSGAGLIAYRSGCDVIPVFIKTKGNKYGLFKKTEIFYGTPIKNSELGFKCGGRDEYDVATNIIFSEILKLGGYTKPTAKENELEG